MMTKQSRKRSDVLTGSPPQTRRTNGRLRHSGWPLLSDSAGIRITQDSIGGKQGFGGAAGSPHMRSIFCPEPFRAVRTIRGGSAVSRQAGPVTNLFPPHRLRERLSTSPRSSPSSSRTPSRALPLQQQGAETLEKNTPSENWA